MFKLNEKKIKFTFLSGFFFFNFIFALNFQNKTTKISSKRHENELFLSKQNCESKNERNLDRRIRDSNSVLCGNEAEGYCASRLNLEERIVCAGHIPETEPSTHN